MEKQRSLTRRQALADDDELWFGTKRSTMASNPLLVKNHTGKARSSTHALPQDVRYGRPPAPDERGVAAAMSWDAAPPPVGIQTRHVTPGKKARIPSGATPPVPASTFVPLAARKEDPLPKARVDKARKRNAIRAEDARQASYGMADILSNAGQHEYLAAHKAREARKAATRGKQGRASKLPGKSMRAARALDQARLRGATKRSPPPKKDLFKISKFKKVGSRIDSRRPRKTPTSASADPSSQQA